VSIRSHIACSVIARSLALSVCVCMLTAVTSPQSIPASSPTPQQQDRSFYLDTPVTHPEDLSGIWEAPDGHGGAIGIHLILDTTAPVEATTLVGTKQKWLGLEVGLYHRTGAQLQLGEENMYSDSLRGGSVRYDDGHLTLHASRYDLDLHRIPGDNWSGRFQRDNFDSQVTLTRPVLQATSKITWFLGTWKSTSPAGPQCLHIAQQSPAGYTAWSDTLTVWGPGSFAPQIPKPPYAWEHYGDLVKVEPTANGVISIELGAYSPICCPHLFLATPEHGGKDMKADWPLGPSQGPYKSKWIKMPGNTCITPVH
jgi:hypothetical protein